MTEAYIPIIVPGLDDLVARLTRIEANMATKADVERAFDEMATTVRDTITPLGDAIENVARDIENLSSSKVTDEDIAAARANLATLRQMQQQLASVAAVTPDNPTPDPTPVEPTNPDSPT
jgi:hypothetical protein